MLDETPGNIGDEGDEPKTDFKVVDSLWRKAKHLWLCTKLKKAHLQSRSERIILGASLWQCFRIVLVSTSLRPKAPPRCPRGDRPLSMCDECARKHSERIQNWPLWINSELYGRLAGYSQPPCISEEGVLRLAFNPYIINWQHGGRFSRTTLSILFSGATFPRCSAPAWPTAGAALHNLRIHCYHLRTDAPPSKPFHVAQAYASGTSIESSLWNMLLSLSSQIRGLTWLCSYYGDKPGW